MERERKSLFSKAMSLALAVVMMVSVIGIIPQDVSAADFTIPGKGTQIVQIPDESCFEIAGVETYIQFKPAATGYVTVKAQNISAIYTDTWGGISLCNAARKVISENDERYYTEYSDAKYTTMTFGVKAKTTYYLRVKAMGGTKITASFKKLKVNKKALSNSKKAKTNGTSGYSGIKVTFCKSNKKNFLSNSYIFASRSQSTDRVTFLKRNVYTGKETGIDAGTYYVKVEPYTVSSSGYYTLKWK